MRRFAPFGRSAIPLMAEEYAGVKFKTLFEGASFGCPGEREAIVAELSRLRSLSLLHGIPGNVSVRAKAGIVITPTGMDLAKVREADMVFVSGVNESAGIIKAFGRHQPSSESMMHWLIYKEFPDANAIVHFHSDELLRTPGRIPKIDKAHPYGTLALARAALEALRKSKALPRIIILREHGALVVGQSLESCHKLVEKAAAGL